MNELGERPSRMILNDADRLFREFDEFFVRLEAEFVKPSWGRSE